MQMNELGPIVTIALSLFPTLILLSVVVAFLARHFRISLLLIAISEAAWLVAGGYSQYLIWSGRWSDGGLSIQTILQFLNYSMTLVHIAGMVLLLMEWSKLVREREAGPPMM
ncbi:MAG: hypothetical protein JNM49_07740 [Flavobacteriales bacterium]|jgi:hypothetical protein|nr:hypothetical protein [Flavobacteriales bacterium]